MPSLAFGSKDVYMISRMNHIRKELAQKFHGIKDIEYIKAEELDIIGAEIENIINKSEKKIDKLAQDIVKEYK